MIIFVEQNKSKKGRKKIGNLTDSLIFVLHDICVEEEAKNEENFI